MVDNQRYADDYFASKEYQEGSLEALADNFIRASFITNTPIQDAEKFVQEVWAFFLREEWWGNGELQLTFEDARRLLLHNP